MQKVITIIAIAICLSANAQTNIYHPFPTIYGDWGMLETIYPSGGIGSIQEYQYIYYTSGDTIINTLNYKKVNYINEGMFMGVNTPLNQIFTGGTYNFAYRNDSLNKKVYIVPNDSIHETLWYNFNLHIGDTLKGTYSTNSPYSSGSGMTLKVDSIDSMLVCGNYRKRYLCTCGGSPTPYSQEYLIEGMGFTSNFINMYLSNICAFEPVVLYSTNAWSEDACQNELGIKNNIASTIKMYPNPNNGSFIIEPNNVTKQTIRVYDITGKLVLNQTINSKTIIDANSLSEGVYNISMSSNEGVINKRLVIVK